MFIREKIKKAKGKEYIQHQLTESFRTPVGPRQRLVLNLGFVGLPEDKFKELANTTENELHKQPQLFSTDPEIERLAKHYAGIIIKDRLKEKNDEPNEQEDAKPDYESVDINSLSTSEARTIGAEHIVLSQMEEYKFDKILGELGFNKKQIDYAKILVVGRLVHPASERETARWANETSAILELLDTRDKFKVKVSQMKGPVNLADSLNPLGQLWSVTF